MNSFDGFFAVVKFFQPILDIGLLTFLFYKAYRIIVKTNSIQIIKAGLIVAVAYALAYFLQLGTMLWIFNTITPILLIAFAIVFQPELRKVFLKLGQSQWFSFTNRSKHSYVDSVLIAAETLSSQRRGMLAVFLRHTNLDDIMMSGTKLNADLTSSLLVTIFGHDTPFHDGACFILGGKVISAGCFLPLSEQYDIKKTFGTRHRAALGLSEVSDAVVLVVSEESGAISLAYDSKLYYDLSQEKITKILDDLLDVTAENSVVEDTVDEHKNVN
ncbi:MAG: diadenylate cyclase CdaA [Treponema sp.]|nr:diadenylate cyclase CdaA [Treponema sp.]